MNIDLGDTHNLLVTPFLGRPSSTENRRALVGKFLSMKPTRMCLPLARAERSATLALLALGLAVAPPVLSQDGLGRIVLWGRNDAVLKNLPPDLTNVVAVSGGEHHCLALLRTGRIVAWGSNASSVLDVPKGLPRITAIAAGWNHNLALTDAGLVVGWGANRCGRQHRRARFPTLLQ